MGKTFRCQGIIIKRSNLGEADRILTIFSDRCGKIRAVAKGVKKIHSKLGGHLELFCLSDLALAEGKNLDIVTEAEIINPYYHLREDLEKIKIASEMALLLDQAVHDQEENRRVFNLLKESLEFLDNSSLPVTCYWLLVFFRLNLLSDLGYCPELDKCVVCGQTLTPDNNYFSFSLGGILHGLHFDNDPMAVKIGSAAIKLLRLMLKSNLKIIAKVKLTSELIEETDNIVDRFWRFTLDK